ncbi:MAG: ral nucleoside transport system permease protein [Actinomycetota bacterium]|nr:ral nucleoside transport system permease protein [Actinomycetota bacterium]
MSGEIASSIPVADTGTDRAELALGETTPGDGEPGGPGSAASDRANGILREIFSGSVTLTVLSIVLALVAGGILMAATNSNVQAAAGYFLARPSDTLSAIWQSVSGGYVALFRGGVYNFEATNFATGMQSFLGGNGQAGSLGYATPLIAAGLGIAVGFRSGVFNIGGQGQVLVAAALAGYVSFAWNLPVGIHMIVAVLAALIGGAIWAGIVGLLKARTGAHEVIVTIMLNYIAFYLLDYFLHTPVLRAPGSQNPQTPAAQPSAILFPLLGNEYALDFGFILVIAATIYCWWLLSRSNLGFKFRAVGENPRAARVAGIRINRMYIYVMLISGVLLGLAGAYQALGNPSGVTGFGGSIDAGIGFSGITVALLGRSRPWGVFAAGILFGILQAGSYTIQADQQVDPNIVPVIQSVIVLFLAAPPLVRAIFHLPAPARREPKAKKPSATTPSVPTQKVADAK